MRALPGWLTVVLAGLLVIVGVRWAMLEFAAPPAGPDGAPRPGPPAGSVAAAPASPSWSFNPWAAADAPPGAGGAPAEVAPDAGWLEDAEADLPPEILERARRQLGREADGRRAERRAAIRDEVDNFIEEEGLDEAKAEALTAIFDRMEQTMLALRESARAGDADPRENMLKMRDAREATREETTALLGDEAAERLRDRLRDVAGPPGPGGGFGPFGGPGFGGPGFGGPGGGP